MRVLVVEDSRTLADALVEGLRDEGMAVDVAYDGLQAATKLDLNAYDVVVLDRDLPGVHGDTHLPHDHRAREPGDGAHAHGLRHTAATGQRPQPRSRRLPVEAVPSSRARAPHPCSRPAPAHRPSQDLPRRPASSSTPSTTPRPATDARLDLSAKEFAVLEALMRARARRPQRRSPVRPGMGRASSTRSATRSRSPSAGCGASSESRRRSRRSPMSGTASRKPPDGDPPKSSVQNDARRSGALARTGTPMLIRALEKLAGAAGRLDGWTA